MGSLKSRLNVHFTACAAVAATAVAAAPQQAQATIVYTAAANINIPATTQGVYVNIQSGANATSPMTGWDVNPWNATGLGFFSPTAPAGGAYVLSAASTAANLAFGAPISGASTFGSGVSTNVAQWNLNSTNNLVGFRFVNEAAGNQVQFGWMRLSLSGTIAGQRSIVEYAYENSGAAIGAGVIPAPGAFALLGAAGLVGSRRRRSA